MIKNFLYFIIVIFICSCSEYEASPENFGNLKAESSATDAMGNTYEVGFEQVSSNNQNPFVLKKDAAGEVIWKINHEKTPVDGRAVLIAIDDKDRIFVTFSVDGGSNDNTFINKHQVENNAFKDVFMNSYGSGGGPKVSVLAEINPVNGKIIRGTFFTARLTNGKTNGMGINKIGFNDVGIILETTSAAWPPGKGRNYQRYPGITDEDRIDGFFQVNYVTNYNMSEILDAEVQ